MDFHKALLAIKIASKFFQSNKYGRSFVFQIACFLMEEVIFLYRQKKVRVSRGKK